jgi:hypothetical protein
MTLTDRLILGCARLTGGASAGEAEALVRAALDAGIGHIDTAPSYGMGTAEVVVGRAVRRFGGPVRITAKLGSARDPHAVAKSWLRRIKRTLGGSQSNPWQASEPPPARLARPSGHDFGAAAMRASLSLSREHLGQIDFLLLHDISAGEVNPALLAELAELAASVDAEHGYASQAQWDAELDARFPFDGVGQCAMTPAWLTGAPGPGGAKPLFLHSVVKAGAWLRATAPAFSTQLDLAARIVGTADTDTNRIAALYAAASHAFPDARLIIASSHRSRILAVSGAIARIDHAGNAAEIAAMLRS